MKGKKVKQGRVSAEEGLFKVNRNTVSAQGCLKLSKALGN